MGGKQPIMKHQKIAVIMAGGKSSRMKRDKALLPFGDYPTLAQYQYERLSTFFDKVYISSKGNKFNFEVELIKDSYEASSPLVALVSIFETLEVNEIFVLGVDAPFVSKKTIEQLYQEALPLKDIVVAHSPYGTEPLCAIYRRSSLKVAKTLLTQNTHRLQTLLKTLNTQVVEFNSKEEFANLNHLEEYQKALTCSLLTSCESSSS